MTSPPTRNAETLRALRQCLEARLPREQQARGAAALIRKAGRYRWVGLYDALASEIAVIAWDGPAAPAYPRFPATQGLSGAAVASGRPVIVQDVTRDPRYLATLDGTRAEMIVPVRDSSRRVVGTIDVESDRVGAFGPDDVRLLSGCAKVSAPLWEPIQMAQFSLPDRRAAGAPPGPWTNAAAYESHIGRWSRK